MRPCPACGAEAADDAAFCPRCGMALSAACSSCGAALPQEARFCATCGHPVERPEPAQERKLVTVLFADVTGFTGLGEQLDAERLKEVMDAYFATMRDAIEAEGGTVEKYIGDAVMAAFGVPVAHEDDPTRALRAALGMRDKLAALNASLLVSHGVSLEMRVGINSGEVMAVTDPEARSAMVTGDAVSVAARLEQNAEPGQILVAERVARATRGFAFADVGPLALKGKGHPVRALRLLSEERTFAERGIPGLRAPLVGRDSEMAVLETLFSRVATEGRAQLITIYGDPGVGKSRLVAEFLQRIEARMPAPLLLAGRCLPYGEGVTYWPLAEILKGLAGVLDTDPPAMAIEKIRKVGRELLTPDVTDEPARATAALAYTVGVEDPDVSFRDLPPRQVRLETHGAWRSFFSGLATERTVVVLIEDIHWADPALLDLLEELADKVQGPVLLICPARPELTQRRPAWGGGKRNFSSIALDPLTPAETDRLIGLLLSIEDLPTDAHERILARAEGNPFFVEEIIRHLIDEGRIIHEGGAWRGTAECGEVVIPDTVQGVLAARIDLLTPQEKRVIQTAAVVGRVFWAEPLRRLAAADIADVDDVLDALETRELIRARLSSSIGGDREFIFKHVLTRDVAYESLPRRERAPAHARVGSWLEETAGDRSQEFAELLSYHFGEAYHAAENDRRLGAEELEALRGKAFEYTLLSAQVARSRYVIDASRRLAEQALAIGRGGIERSLAMETLALSHQQSYNGDDAWRYLKQAVDEAVAAGDADDRHVARLCGYALETPTRWPGSMRNRATEAEARPYLETGLAHAERLPGDSWELARLLVIKSFWGFAFPEGYTPGRHEQEYRDGMRAADMARRLDLPELESSALDGANSPLMMQGLYREAVAVTKRRLEVMQRVRDPWELGDGFAVASWCEFMSGRFAEAELLATEGADRTMEHVQAVAIHCISWRSLARYRLGDWDGALSDERTIRQVLGGRLPPYFVTRTLAVAALIHEIRGNEAAADERLSVLQTITATDPATLSGWAGWLPTLYVYRGQVDHALKLAFESLALPLQGALRAPTYEALCHVLAEAERWDQASEEGPMIRAYAERGGMNSIPWAVDRMEGRAAHAAGDHERAAEFLSRSASGFASLSAVWDEALSLLFLGETLLALGRREEASDALGRAAPTFERLGAGRELSRSRELAP